MSELKPCPFCDGTILRIVDGFPNHVWFVECDTPACEAVGPNGINKQAAIDAWNKRPDAAERKEPADPFMPDWSKAPPDATLHTVDADGYGAWWKGKHVFRSGIAWHTRNGPNKTRDDAEPMNMEWLDWRDSLRGRP